MVAPQAAGRHLLHKSSKLKGGISMLAAFEFTLWAEAYLAIFSSVSIYLQNAKDGSKVLSTLSRLAAKESVVQIP